jgi:PKD repeat protein
LRRISSSDPGYSTGDLSLFPDALDDRDSLYEARNNAETRLRTGLSYNGKQIVVESTDGFPDKGLVRVGPPAGSPGDAELIYYDAKTSSVLKGLTRGFAGSRQNQWPAGSWATNAVTAEPHNAVKDALINMQRKLGLKIRPEEGTLAKKLHDLELRYMSPKATFRAFPRRAKPGDSVRFQSLCEGEIVRYLWDFGDGTQSVEENPVHSYASEGTYTVRLHLITSSGAQGIATKSNYLTVSDGERTPFFYARRVEGRTYRFVDQTDGEVVQRFWVFGDGEKHVEADPNVHERVHTYMEPGVYNPSLLVGFAGSRVRRVFLRDQLEVE